MRQKEDQKKKRKKEDLKAQKLLIYIKKMSKEQYQAFINEMAVDNKEEAARIEAKLQVRKAVIAHRRAEIRKRRREQAQRELEQDLIKEPENN